MHPYAKHTPRQLRELMRSGNYTQPTAGLALGYAQANLVILKQKLAFDFLLFCQRNAIACPVLEVLEPGRYEAKFLASGSDLRTDLPRYRVFRDAANAYDFGPDLADVVAEYLAGTGPYTPYTDGRITAK